MPDVMPKSNIPILLSAPRYEAHRRQTSVDYQKRFRPDLRSARSIEDCILLWTRRLDHEADRLSLELAETGVPLYRIDSDDAPEGTIAGRLNEISLQIDGFTVRPTLIWIRHFEVNGIMHAGSAELSAYLRLQWQAALATFAQWPGAYSINGKVGATLPRMRQLEAASAADVPIPATCVASSSSVAAELLGVSVDNLIAKPIGDHLVEVVPGQVVGAFARRLNNESMLGHQEPAPILFQEYSPHAYELRVFLVGSQLLSFRVEKRSALELWSNPSDVDVQVCETPERVSQYIMGLNRVFSLDYGAFDFLATNGGEFIFLEVNIEGDWAYFESKAETDLVSDAVRRMLTDLFRSHA